MINDNDYDKQYVKAITMHTNLIMCLNLLKEACSPWVPSSGKDYQWLAHRDAVVANAERDLAKYSDVSSALNPEEYEKV